MAIRSNGAAFQVVSTNRTGLPCGCCRSAAKSRMTNLPAQDGGHRPALGRHAVERRPAAARGDPAVLDGARQAQIDDGEIGVIAARDAALAGDAENALRPRRGEIDEALQASVALVDMIQQDRRPGSARPACPTACRDRSCLFPRAYAARGRSRSRRSRLRAPPATAPGDGFRRGSAGSSGHRCPAARNIPAPTSVRCCGVVSAVAKSLAAASSGISSPVVTCSTCRRRPACFASRSTRSVDSARGFGVAPDRMGVAACRARRKCFARDQPVFVFGMDRDAAACPLSARPECRLACSSSSVPVEEPRNALTPQTPGMPLQLGQRADIGGVAPT